VSFGLKPNLYRERYKGYSKVIEKGHATFNKFENFSTIIFIVYVMY
jgi:hypothetical protein